MAENTKETSPAESRQNKFILTVDDKSDTETLEGLKRRKPYNAIMIILLFLWPRQRREEVIKDLNILRTSRSDDASHAISIEINNEFTDLLWHDLNVKSYYQYVNRHKSYVTFGFQSLNEIVTRSVKGRLHLDDLLLDEYRPSEDPDSEQIENHDNSKYSFTETVTYAMRWNPCHDLGEYDTESWESGLQHHYCHNEHHPEFWGDKPMHWRYIVEAMYDMVAMELERKFYGQKPDNVAELLVFNPQYLQRFERTKQLTFVKKLIQYTMEEYCKETKHKLPELPELLELPRD